LNNWTAASTNGSDSVHQQPFTLRHYPKTLVKPLQQLLKFAWRDTSSLFTSIREKADNIGDPDCDPNSDPDSDPDSDLDSEPRRNLERLFLVVTDVVMTAILEKSATSGQSDSQFSRCLLAACCKSGKTTNPDSSVPDNVTLLACDSNSKSAAAHLAMMKVAVCYKIKNMTVAASQCSTFNPEELVLAATTSVTFTKLASFIRGMREMDGRKFKLPPASTTVVGDVLVGDYMFAKSQWSRLIPDFCDRWTVLLREFIRTSDWTYFLDHRNDLVVTKIDNSFNVRARTLGWWKALQKRSK
jgi:hypothetical protein